MRKILLAVALMFGVVSTASAWEYFFYPPSMEPDWDWPAYRKTHMVYSDGIGRISIFKDDCEKVGNPGTSFAHYITVQWLDDDDVLWHANAGIIPGSTTDGTYYGFPNITLTQAAVDAISNKGSFGQVFRMDVAVWVDGVYYDHDVRWFRVYDNY